jgi:hypothetical protein
MHEGHGLSRAEKRPGYYASQQAAEGKVDTALAHTQTLRRQGMYGLYPVYKPCKSFGL